MNLFKFLRDLLAFDFPKEQEIKVRILFRDTNDVVRKIKIVPIQSIHNLPYTININQTDIENTNWKKA